MKIKIQILLIILSILSLTKITYAEKVYLDITQPGIKKINLALIGFDRIDKVFNTIKEALEFTDYFEVFGPFPTREEKFQPALWQSSNIDIIIRATVSDKIKINFFTVTGENAFFTKEFNLQNNELTGNLIASDIYKILTGREAPFFNRFVFIRKFKQNHGIFLSNWNGKNIQDTGIRRELISKVILRGNRIFYSSLQGKYWHIEVFDLLKKTNREILRSRALLQLGDVIDDSQLLFLKNDGELSEIRITEISGKEKTIISSRWIESSPRWSFSKIYFVSNRSGSPQIYQIQNSRIIRLTFQGKYNTEPSVNPEGDKLAFSSLVNGFQVFILDLNSMSQTQLTQQGNNEQPSFCPDGHFLTIMSDRRGRKEIYLLSSNGMVQKPLTIGYLPHCSK